MKCNYVIHTNCLPFKIIFDFNLGCMDKYCVLCFNASHCYECAHGYFMQDDSTCQGEL